VVDVAMMHSMPSSLRIGPYQVGHRLGVGGMSEVYIAMRENEVAPVALKLLLPHLANDDSSVHMFINEARIVAPMNHPNIVRVLDVGKDGERFYQAMELVTGVSLSSLMRALHDADRRPSPRLVVYVARALCTALHYAHGLRSEGGQPLEIVHRDVSPQNLLISTRGEVKLSDFGIARARHTTRVTVAGRVRGKCEYLAPEQARGLDVDHRADLFAAAITLTHFATFISPFRRDQFLESMEAVVYEPLPSLAEMRSDLPAELCEAVRIAAEKDPRDRFASAQKFLDALPPEPEGAKDELGALIVELCRAEVDQLQEKTSATAALGTQTGTGNVAARVGGEGGRRTQTGPAPQLPFATLLDAGPDARTTFDPGSDTGHDPLAAEATGVLDARPRASRLPLMLGAVMVLAVGVGFMVLNQRRDTARLDEVAPTQVSPARAFPVRSASEPKRAEAKRESPPEVKPAEPKGVEAPPAKAAPEPQLAALAAVVTEPAAAEAPAAAPVRKKVRWPARERERERDQSHRTGFLTVDASPWAQVYARGRHLGETPLASVPMEAGEVSVVLKSPDTGKEVTRTVFITPGREVFLKEDLK
jgi:serine/threonine-protein kinase